MSSGMIQVQPIGVRGRGMGTALLGNRVSLARDHPLKGKHPVVCKLFGAPEKGEIKNIYKQHESKELAEFTRRFSNLEHTNNPDASTAASNGTKLIPEENLLEKERRDYENKYGLKQMKSEENATQKVVDTSVKCSSSGKRAKPYDKHQASVTDHFNQRKIVVRSNNNRTSDMHSSGEVSNELLLPPPLHIQENVEDVSASAAVPSNESSSSASNHHQCEQKESANIIAHD